MASTAAYNPLTYIRERVYSLYYYAIKPKQPLGGDTAACVLKDCILQQVVRVILAHWRQA